MAIKAGLAGKVYWKAGQISTAGTYAELKLVRDVSVESSATEIDASSRASLFKKTLAGQVDTSFEFEAIYDMADTGIAALQSAYLNRTLVALKILDGPDTVGSGSQGWFLDVVVLKFTRSEPLDGVQTVTIMVKPAPSNTEPAWITVT